VLAHLGGPLRKPIFLNIFGVDDMSLTLIFFWKKKSEETSFDFVVGKSKLDICLVKKLFFNLFLTHNT